MQISTDLTRGIRQMEIPALTEARLGPVDVACRFRVKGEAQTLLKSRPDAIVEENGRIVLTQIWRGATPAERLVFAAEFTPDADDNSLRIVTRVTNELHEPIALDSLDPLIVRADLDGKFSLGFSAGEWSIFRNGWQSWSATRTFRLIERDPRPLFKFIRDQEENPANLSPNKYGVFVSEQVLGLRNVSTGQSMALGFVTVDRAFGDVRLEINPKTKQFNLLRARCQFDGLAVQPGETVTGETLWLKFAGRGVDLLAEWADLHGAAMHARLPERAPVGWCSWYYYYTKISESELKANLETLTPMREELGLEFFQLDDGYQAQIGDWLIPNEKFPSGLQAMADTIAAAGFTPGIWTAPFLAHAKSRVALEHPDWLLRDERGKALRGSYNPLWDKLRGMKILDPTHPGVLAYLEEVFTTLKAMGWKFFKIDFLYAAAFHARRHDPLTTRASALRRGLETIRRAIGDDATLLGCGCPLGPAVGIVDAMRIGPDVTPRWTNPLRWLNRDHHCLATVHALRNTTHRQFMHERLWCNDPDCLLVRQNKNKMTLDEIRTFTSLAALTGGMMLISDDMTQLAPERLDVLRTVLANRGRNMRVLDPDAGEYPTTMLAETDDGYLLLVINHEKEESGSIFDLKQILDLAKLARVAELRDVWQNSVLHEHDGLVRLGAIPPHGCRLVRIRLRESGNA